jgi:LuxR family maltose regulon positive regulatory protein
MPFAWISLDAADNDQVRFWDGVVAALQTVAPTIGGPARTILHSPGVSVRNHVVPVLINELGLLGHQIVLVLDDYHVIASEQIHRDVEFLIDRLPPTVRLVIATRSDPPLPLGRLRARAQLTEIRAGELRFSVEEAGAFLNDVLELDLDATEVARLQQRTEGWIAGLQLAGLSLRGRHDRRAFIESFAGDDRQIVDYLGFEVLDSQPGPVRAFLLESAILDRLTGSLCAAVTETDDAARVLAELEHANLFVVPLDSRREWYRYHHLFGDLLRHELQRTYPALVPTLHKRAADWYRSEGLIQEAIEHALGAGDFALASELITTHWYEFLQRGLVETFAGWFERLPSSLIVEPDLALTKAWLGVNTGNLDEVDRLLQRTDEIVAHQPKSGELPPRASGVASLRAVHRYMSGDVAAAVASGRDALDLERGGPPSPWRPVGCPILGLSLHWRGASDQAADTLADAARIAGRDGNHLAAMHASGGLAAIKYEEGALDAAAELTSRAAELAEEHNLGEHWARSLSLCVRGQLSAQLGRLEEADQTISRAVELARRGVASLEIVYALLSLTDVRHARGLRDDAKALRDDARGLVDECADPGTLSELLGSVNRRLRQPRFASARQVDGMDQLSDAELSVLRLLRSELSQREIGSELFISFNTVKTHARNIYRKLGVATRDEAVQRAKQLRLL